MVHDFAGMSEDLRIGPIGWLMSRRGLWTIGSSGQGARQLTRTSTEDLDPDWLKPATPSRTG